MAENAVVNEPPSAPQRTVLDDQTGREFALVPEQRVDTLCATASIIYLILMLVAFLWLLFDIWAGNLFLFQRLAYGDQVIARLRTSSTFHLLAYAFCGGGLGGVIGGYCSFSAWHCERQAFGWRFIWKYITYPWLGGTLALVVYAIMVSGVAVVGGSAASGEVMPTLTQSLFSLSIGALVGYGSPRVMKWLDAQVDRLFKIELKTAGDKATETAKPIERTAAADAEGAIDGCDVGVASVVTADEQLPVAAGGVV